jgi:hypothetical protein
MGMSETNAEQQEANADETREALRNVYGNPEDGQHYNDRSKLDWDPADGVYSGTAVDGTSEIAGPHENQDDVTPEQKAEMRSDDDVTEGVQQKAAEGEAAARETDSDRTAETETAMRKEPADVAAGEEIDNQTAP